MKLGAPYSWAPFHGVLAPQAHLPSSAGKEGPPEAGACRDEAGLPWACRQRCYMRTPWKGKACGQDLSLGRVALGPPRLPAPETQPTCACSCLWSPQSWPKVPLSSVWPAEGASAAHTCSPCGWQSTHCRVRMELQDADVRGGGGWAAARDLLPRPADPDRRQVEAGEGLHPLSPTRLGDKVGSCDCRQPVGETQVPGSTHQGPRVGRDRAGLRTRGPGMAQRCTVRGPLGGRPGVSDTIRALRRMPRGPAKGS